MEYLPIPSDRDAERGAEIADLSHRPDLWPTANRETLEGLVALKLIEYGEVIDGAMVPYLTDLYQVFERRFSSVERGAMLRNIVWMIEKGRGSYISLLPFLFMDHELHIAAEASLNIAVLTELKGGDEMTGPKIVLGFLDIHRDDEVIRAASLSGLLLLGDRRVLALIKDSWRLLSTKGRHMLANNQTEFLQVGTIDYYLDWLEDSSGNDFVAVAQGLARMPRLTRGRSVFETHRKFPAFAPDPRPAVIKTAEWTIAEYARVIEPRLRDLARRVDQPGVINLVLEAWGLEGL